MTKGAEYTVGITMKADGSGAVVNEFKRIEKGGKQAASGLDQTDKAARRAGKGLEQGAKGGQSMTRQAGLLSGALGALGIAALARDTFDAAREFESWNASLKTVTGSSQGAQKAFAMIQKFAENTPFNLKQSVEGFIKLKALGLDPSAEALNSYGNTASAMGRSLTQMVEAVADASTGEFERLKEFGIKASSTKDEVSFTFQGVTQTVKKNSEEIQRYLLAIGNTEFAGAMAEQMNTMNGAISNAQDAFGRLQRNLFVQFDLGSKVSALFGSMAGAIDGMTAFVITASTEIAFFLDALAHGDGAFKIAREGLSLVAGAFSSIFEFLSPVIEPLGEVVAVMLGSQAAWAIGAAGVGLVVTGFKTLGSVLLANPVVAIITGIAVAAKLIYDNWDGIAKFFTELWDSVKSSTRDALKVVTDLIDEVLGALKDMVPAALQIGKDFIAGMVKGITSGASAAVNAAKEMAGDVVVSVKSFFKIQSPSKVMEAVGKHVTAGLTVGILLGAPGAAQAAEKVASDIANTFGVALSDIATDAKHTFGVMAADANTALPAIGETMDDAAEHAYDYGEALSSGIGDSIADVIVDGGSLRDNLKDIWKQIARDFVSSGVSNLISSIFGGGSGGSGGGAQSLVSSLGGKAVAKGLSSLFTGSSASGAGGAAAGGGAAGGAAAGGGAAAAGSVILPVALAIGINARNKKRKAERAAEYAQIINSGALTGGFSSGAVDFAGIGATGADGSIEAFAQLTTETGNQVKLINQAWRDIGARVWTAADGLVKITGSEQEIIAAKELALGYDAEAADFWAQKLDAQQRLNELSGDADDINESNRASLESVTREMRKNLDLVNSANYDGMVKAMAKASGASIAQLKKISQNGTISAQEVGATFKGEAAAQIIEAMDGASAISVIRLMEILGVSQEVGQGIAKSFEEGAKGAVTSLAGVETAINNIPKEFSVTGTVQYNESARPRSNFEGGASGGFADGGIAYGSTRGHYELLHGNELVIDEENTRRLLSGGGTRGLNITGRGGSDTRRLEGLIMSLNERVDRVVMAVDNNTHDRGAQQRRAQSAAALREYAHA